MRTRQDDELIAIAMASNDPTIGVVYLLKSPSEIDALLRKVTTLGGSASYIDHKLGYIRAIVPAPVIRRALNVPAGDVASVDLDLSFHSALPSSGLIQPPPDMRGIQAEINSAATQKFLRAPSPILHDLDADGWRHDHPTFDGRGITIADVEGLVDPMVPELSGALSLDGKPIRKIAGMHIAIDPDDRSAPGSPGAETNNNSDQWVDMRTQVRGTDRVVYEGASYHLPHPGAFRIGYFNLVEVAKYTYFLNPKVLEPAIGDGVFAVLWEPSHGLVWVDVHRSHDFRQARAMRDFNVSGDWSYFGALHSVRYPLLHPAASFVVLEDPHKESVAIALGIDLHASGVATSAAGTPIGPKDPVHGVAPAAQIDSFEYQPFKLHSHAEALIAAFEDPKTNLIVYEWDTRLHTQFEEEGWFMGVLGERLVQKFDKPLFVPGGNFPVVASIDDAGIGPDVIAVSGSQSAASYWRYDGFRPSTNIHKHWGALTDGPEQDGGLKPDLLAPSGYTAAVPRYFWDPFFARKPGLYTLPAGLARFGGTSQATPTAAGAAALLLSAAKQEGFHVHAATLANALRLGANLSPELTAYEEGNGLLDVATAWEILKTQSRDLRLSNAGICAGSVRTAQWPNGTPNGGKGIFETIGWHPGDHGVRAIRFCLPRILERKPVASLLLNDGTYRITGLQTAGNFVEVTVAIKPLRAGLHSALVQLNDWRGHVIGRSMITIAAAAALDAANHYSMQQKMLIPRPGYTTTFVDIPKGTDALIVHADRDIPFALVIQGPSGSEYPYVPAQFFTPTAHHSITIPGPMAGTWAILLVDIHDVVDSAREVLAVEPLAATVSAQAVRVDRSSSRAATSIFAKVPVREVGSVQTLATESGQFASVDPVLIPINVPEDTDAVMVDLSGSDSWVDAYFFDCRHKTCASSARIVGSGSDKRLTIPHVPMGHYYLALDDYDPTQPNSGLPNYRVSVLAYTRSGLIRPLSSALATGRAYEVNCESPSNEIVSSPKCGLFLTK